MAFEIALKVRVELFEELDKAGPAREHAAKMRM